jgi:hypothetical protein
MDGKISEQAVFAIILSVVYNQSTYLRILAGLEKQRSTV